MCRATVQQSGMRWASGIELPGLNPGIPLISYVTLTWDTLYNPNFFVKQIMTKSMYIPTYVRIYLHIYIYLYFFLFFQSGFVFQSIAPGWNDPLGGQWCPLHVVPPSGHIAVTASAAFEVQVDWSLAWVVQLPLPGRVSQRIRGKGRFLNRVHRSWSYREWMRIA